MALTLKDQMDIIEGRIGPETATGGDPELSFMDLIHIGSYNQAVQFKESPKDTTGDDLATSYLQKMNNISNNIMLNNGQVRGALLYTLMSIGAPNTDIATVQALTISGWENFVTSNMLETMEKVSNVTPAEKSAYDALS